MLVRALVCFLFLLAVPAKAESLRVTLVLSESGGVYQEFSDALQRNISPHHHLKIAQVGEAVPAGDLLVAVGMRAATALSHSELPVLNVFVPRSGYAGLERASSAVSSAIYMDQPMERQLALLSAVLPDAKNIGVLYANSPQGLETLKRMAVGKFVLHERVVSQKQRLSSALSALLEESEVLLVLPDPAVYSSETIRNILLETYRQQIPMIGISPSYVRAGALCAVFSTPGQIAHQAAGEIESFAAHGRLSASQYPREFEVMVNTQVARSLGLSIEDAEKLRAKIKGEP